LVDRDGHRSYRRFSLSLSMFGFGLRPQMARGSDVPWETAFDVLPRPRKWPFDLASHVVPPLKSIGCRRSASDVSRSRQGSRRPCTAQ